MLQIELVPITEIRPYENNAKIHTPEQIEQIKKSILEFGNNDPIAIDGEGVIIEGHGRLMALQELGYTEVEVIRLGHLTEEQRKAYTLVHNKLTMNTGFDLDILATELQAIETINMKDYDFDLDIVDDVCVEDIEEDNFNPEVPEEATAKRGQVYQLGEHRLMCGDSTSPADVQKLMGDEQADCLLTDPPYNVNYGGDASSPANNGKHRLIENDNLTDSDFYKFLLAFYQNAEAALKPGGSFYIWHADSEGFNFRYACKKVGWTVRQCLIWNKNVLVMGRQDYQWKHEPCLYGWKDGAGHYWASDRKQTTVIALWSGLCLRGKSRSYCRNLERRLLPHRRSGLEGRRRLLLVCWPCGLCDQVLRLPDWTFRNRKCHHGTALCSGMWRFCRS